MVDKLVHVHADTQKHATTKIKQTKMYINKKAKADKRKHTMTQKNRLLANASHTGSNIPQ